MSKLQNVYINRSYPGFNSVLEETRELRGTITEVDLSASGEVSSHFEFPADIAVFVSRITVDVELLFSDGSARKLRVGQARRTTIDLIDSPVKLVGIQVAKEIAKPNPGDVKASLFTKEQKENASD